MTRPVRQPARGARPGHRGAATAPSAGLLVAALLALPGLHLLTACGNQGTVIQPRTFDRPERVAFGCYDRLANVFVPLAGCDAVELDRDEEDFALIGLVTQTAQGEVAAVDLDMRLVLDADVRVPGFTFVLVGENPTAIVVPTLTARHTYVANQTSRTITWLPLAQFHPDAQATDDVGGQLALPGSPSDMVLSPAEDFLYVALPDNGTIGEIAVDSTNPTAPLTFVREIALDATIPTQVAAVEAAAPYRRFCPTGYENNLPQPELAAPRAPIQVGATPRPSQLTVDLSATPPVLLVSDANLPIIHRLVLDAAGADAAALTPLAPGVPTEQVVVTPPVPATTGDRSATQRYLYAIDVTDNSVLAMDYTVGAANFGAVLSVNTGDNAPDRLALRAGAGRLRVVEPGYVVTGGNAPAECNPAVESEAEEALPSTLRGVFLLAGQVDGNLAIVDVYDLDAPCRGGAGCANPDNENDVHVRIERHRPRIGTFTLDDPDVVGFPALSFDGSAGQIQASGFPSTGSGPRLESFACPSGMVRVYPDSGSALICASADPWSSPAQSWSAEWEGQLPFAVGGGRFDTSDLSQFITADADLCAWGVLGENDVTASGLAADDPLSGYVGDRLVLTGELVPSIQSALDAGSSSAFERCRPFLDAADRDQVFLEITDAREGSLALRVPVRRGVSGTPIDGDPLVTYTLEDVATCFPGITPFAIHARTSYVVRSSFASYLHRVVSDGGSCRVDAARPVDPADPQTRVEGRAFVGRPYVNPYLAFHISDRRADGSTVGSMEGLRSVFTVTTRLLPAVAVIDIGRIVSDVLLTPNRENLIVIDSAASSLGQYALDPLVRQASVQ
ncbi:MAG: hypothetical protein R3B40_02165 [Polyangiales bacterium]|nr:hypothetical protein [Myxococcales bacterium]MCB9658751.1 hypothetical protein [Sandaracinaceae bacterium]